MTLKFGLSAALLAIAASAAAQQPSSATPPAATPPPSQAAIQQAAVAFGQCVSTGVQAVPASVTPEAGASNVLNGCMNQRQQLEQAVNNFIDTLPEDQRVTAHEQARTQLAGINGQIADGIRQMRAAPAAAPTPTPAH